MAFDIKKLVAAYGIANVRFFLPAMCFDEHKVRWTNVDVGEFKITERVYPLSENGKIGFLPVDITLRADEFFIDGLEHLLQNYSGQYAVCVLAQDGSTTYYRRISHTDDLP